MVELTTFTMVSGHFRARTGAAPLKPQRGVAQMGMPRIPRPHGRGPVEAHNMTATR